MVPRCSAINRGLPHERLGEARRAKSSRGQVNIMSYATTTDDSIARSASIAAVVADEPWEASFSRNPLQPVETVTFLSDEVGVLTHHVRITPRYNAPTRTLDGYRVEKYHQAQEDPTVVESRVPSFEEALTEAQECIERLTH